MTQNQKIYYQNLNRLFDNAEEILLNSKSKIAIFSDLHMGDGSSTDDFKANSKMFNSVLSEYYFPKKYRLVLNGDVEELQRFKLEKIQTYHISTFEIFEKFKARGHLLKTIGNHDLSLAAKISSYPFELCDAIKFKYHGNNIFIFHGHQASKKYNKNNDLVGLSLKYLANPLGIKNFSVSHSSRKKYKIERRVYRYSNFKNIVSIIGHTHRPLFESLTKVQRLKIKIDSLCRQATELRAPKSLEILEKSIKNYKKELVEIHEKQNPIAESFGLYNELFHIPSLFNSGTAIGKRGITCLEIGEGKIRLVHWFNKNISKKYLRNTGYAPIQMKNTDYYKMVINEEELDYIFTKIRLLS